MKILVIPDVHQTREWFDIVKEYHKYFDYIIQVGDWFDTHDEKFSWEDFSPIDNFKKAISLTQQLDNFKLCLGNHDFSYILKSHCSQYQYKHAHEIKQVILDNIDHVNIAYDVDDWIISHAGFSRTWMKKHGFNSIQDVNRAFHNGDYEIFQFDGFEMTGDNITQGPVWIRPRSLYIDSFFKYQIVGHTPSQSVPLVLDCSEMVKSFAKPAIDGQKIIVIDSPTHDCYFQFDTEDLKHD